MLFLFFFLNLLNLIWTACLDPTFAQLSNGKCYKIVANYQYYKDAESACRNQNAQLATIHSKTDNDALSSYLVSRGAEDVWIGLQAVQLNPNVYQWTDQSRVDFTNFFANPPDVSNGNTCFYLRTNGFWYPQHCLRFTDFALCEEINNELSCGDYDEVDGTCLQVKLGSLSFHDAERTCRTEGGYLISIHSSMMNSNIFNELKLGGVSTVGWIGLQQFADAIGWTDGSEANYTNLATPNNPDGSCYAMSVVAFLYPQQWVAESCNTQLPYVCHREKSVNPVTIAPPSTTYKPSNCGQTSFTGSSGTINSPNYPAHFTDDDCVYWINGSSNAINLDVPAISGPQFWRLDIYAGSQPSQGMHIYSISSFDQARALKYSSPIPYMYIHFQADSDNYGTPFQLTWTSTTTAQYPLGDLTGSSIVPPTVTGPTRPPYDRCDHLWIYDDVRDMWECKDIELDSN